jgi:nucleotide-binding universal stress UspA family protein
VDEEEGALMSIGPTTTASDRIVVGIDGSEQSQLALRWAAYLARVSGSTIEAVTAWQPTVIGATAGGFGYMTAPVGWDPAADMEKALVDTLDKVFGTNRPVDLQMTVQEGHATKVLLDAGRRARMLVLGSRGHGGFAGLLLGSVSSACAEHATCPVLVVHGDDPPPDLG